MIDTLNFGKMGGLLPAVVQHARTGVVLMVGFMNREAAERTLADRSVTFWSRSKGRLWTKGETSGNTLSVVSIHADCDGDSLLILADPAGPTCHTGNPSCFSTQPAFGDGGTLRELEEVIHERKRSMPGKSYTASLFREGIARIGQKVGEEAVELAIAAQYDDKTRVTEEAADLLYSLMVLLAGKEIGLGEVLAELGKRRR